MTRLALLLLAAACAAPTTPVRVVAGEETARTGTVSAPSAVARQAAPRPTPSKASRGRSAPRHRQHAPGSLTNCTCYTWTGNRTASGKWPRVGMAASNRYPFGTRLLVEGVGVVTVQDRIGCCTDLDVYLPTEQECRSFGRQTLRVEVLG